MPRRAQAMAKASPKPLDAPVIITRLPRMAWEGIRCGMVFFSSTKNLHEHGIFCNLSPWSKSDFCMSILITQSAILLLHF
jgi:hypothetical protein